MLLSLWSGIMPPRKGRPVGPRAGLAVPDPPPKRLVARELVWDSHPENAT